MAQANGIIEPPIDDLLAKVDSKYALVIFASQRARQINDYYTDLHDGNLFNNVGPLVDSSVDDKPLTTALHEIAEGKLVMKPRDQVVVVDESDHENGETQIFSEDVVTEG